MKKENSSNKVVEVSTSDLATLAGVTACSVYGVVGLLDAKNISNQSSKFFKLIRKEDYKNGVSVKKIKDAYEVSLYVVCAKSVKIVEVIYEIQKQVKYSLKKKYKVNLNKVNVFIQGVK